MTNKNEEVIQMSYRELEAMQVDWLMRRAVAQQRGLEEGFAAAFKATKPAVGKDEESRHVGVTPAEYRRLRRQSGASA